MPKTKISEYSSNPSNNTDVNGINIAEGCAPSGINNAIRQLMADLKNQQDGTSGDNFTVGGNLTVIGSAALGSNATASTQATSDNSTKLATTAYVTSKIAASTSGLADPGGSGIVARTATAGATVARTITQGNGITVTNGNGVSGDPTITLATPGTLTSSTTNQVTASSHTHEVTFPNTITSVNGVSSGAVTISAVSAWVNFNGTGTVAIRASYNVSSITDGGVGTYTINFSSSLADANYAWAAAAVSPSAENTGVVTGINNSTVLTSSGLTLKFSGASNNSVQDYATIGVSVFR